MVTYRVTSLSADDDAPSEMSETKHWKPCSGMSGEIACVRHESPAETRSFLDTFSDATVSTSVLYARAAS